MPAENDNLIDPRTELRLLAEAICAGTATEAELDRLSRRLESSDEDALFYATYLRMHGQLLWQWRVADQVPISPATHHPFNPQPPIPNPSVSSLLSSLSNYATEYPFVASYIIATVLFALAAVAGHFYKVEHYTQYTRTFGTSDVVSPLHTPLPSRPSPVARITDMVDVKWGNEGLGIGDWGLEKRSGVGVQGAGVENPEIPKSRNPESRVPNPQSLVVGDRLTLASGLVQLAYNSGAKVILQGPCTYEVNSPAGGFLSLGKLTARVDSGQWTVDSSKPQAAAIHHSSFSTHHSTNPQSPNPEIPKSPNPLFTVTTPTAVVTDLGTEFGVDVHEDRTTEVCVLQGVVETELVSASGPTGQRRRLVAGESLVCSAGGTEFLPTQFSAKTFAVPIEESGEFTGLRLGRRWTFDTANAGNRWSLTARPGWLRITLYNACQNSWEDRGLAPVLYADLPTPPDKFVVETYIDLASGNNGRSREHSIGGLVVYDAARDNLALTFGLAHNNHPANNEYAVREIALQSPGKHHARIAVDADAAWLRLQRDGIKWHAYYKTSADAPWTEAGEVVESDFAHGPPAQPRIGLFAKTFNNDDPGAPGANVDFDYLRVIPRESEAAD